MTRRSVLALLAAGKARPAVSVIAENARKLNAPSLSAAMIVDGKLAWTEAYGAADLENEVSATTKSIYRYASISKALTASMILRLAEEGLLDLDAPAVSLCPKLKSLKWSVTTRQLLGHLAGIRHYNGRAEALNTLFYSNLTQAVTAALHGTAQVFEPGTRYLYSTRGYTLLGAIAEQVGGMPFARLIDNHVLAPAGLKATRLDHTYELIPNRVRGYFRSQNGDIRNAEFQDTSAIVPGGGLCGTAEDLARFGVALLAGKLVKNTTAMWTEQKTNAGRTTGYGLGWYMAGTGDSLRVWHGGAQSGARGLLLLSPPQNAGVALLTNLEQADLRPAARALFAEAGVVWQDI